VKRVAILAAWFCLGALPAVAFAQGTLARLLAPRGPALSHSRAADYAAAMSAAEQVGPGEGMPLLAARTRWMWVAPDGATVQRIADNTFRWRSNNCIDGFCTAVDCFVATWPELMCSDGAERRIAAPDLATVILNEVEFKRSIP
jgi:hypothetical protein